MPAGLNVFNSFFAPPHEGTTAQLSADTDGSSEGSLTASSSARARTNRPARGGRVRGSYSQVPKRRMYQVFTSWVSVQYASSTPISHGK